MLLPLLTQRDAEMLPPLKAGEIIMLADEEVCASIPVVSPWENQFSFILDLFTSTTIGLNIFQGHLRIFVFYKMAQVMDFLEV